MVKNVLVTGAGSLLGQGILRLLRISDFEKKIYTADPSPLSAGHWLGDHALNIPMVSNVDYIKELKKIIDKFKLDLIFVGTDLELPILAKFKREIREEFNCEVVVGSEEIVNVGNDKFLTAQFLKENNFPFPFSVLAKDMEGLKQIGKLYGYPLFAKPCEGARSVGIKKILNEEELFACYSSESDLVVQEYLSDAEGEYTSGCVVYNGKCKSIVTLKRDLRDGNTYRTFRDSITDKYNETLVKLAEKINPEGPINFQFRILNNQPVVFEINSRLSGTTPIRHFYGFNEVESIAKYLLFGEEINCPKLKYGITLRAWSDVYVSNEDLEMFKRNDELEDVRSEFYGFKL